MNELVDDQSKVHIRDLKVRILVYIFRKWRNNPASMSSQKAYIKAY